MPRSKELSQQMRQQRRQDILQAALKLFSDKGFAATRISDIAKEAQMSQGLIYHYWSDKTQIYLELVESSLQALSQAAEQLEALSNTGRQKLEMAIDGLLRDIQTKDDVCRTHLLISHARLAQDNIEGMQDIFEKYSAKPYQVMSQIFAQAQREGKVRRGNPEQMAVVFWSLIKGLALSQIGSEEPQIENPGSRNIDQIEIMNMFIKGV